MKLLKSNVPMSRLDLDALVARGCPCGCKMPFGPDNLMRLKANCHPEAGCWATYYDGELRLFCARCERPVAKILVARNKEE